MRLGEVGEELTDLLLPPLAGLDLLEPRLLVLLVAGGEVREAALVLQARDALRRRLEVEPQRALDGDLLEAEVVVVEDLADHAHRLDRLLGDRSSSVKVRVSPSLKLPKMRVMSPIWSGSLARRPGRRACCACCRGSSSSSRRSGARR